MTTLNPAAAAPAQPLVKEIHLLLTEAEARKLDAHLAQVQVGAGLKEVYSKLRAICDRLPRRHQLPPGECIYCDDQRKGNTTFHPSHDASHRCESGKRNHCSCDTCF